MIKIELEFKSIDEAIVALGRMVGAPQQQMAAPMAVVAGTGSATAVSPTTQRKGRNDKGKPRGPYKDHAGAPVPVVHGSAQADGAGAAGPKPTLQDSAPVSAAPAPKTAAPDASGPLAELPATAAPATVVPAASEADVKAVVEKLFETKGLATTLEVMSRFGVTRARDLKPEQRDEFVKKANDAMKGGAV